MKHAPVFECLKSLYARHDVLEITLILLGLPDVKEQDAASIESREAAFVGSVFEKRSALEVVERARYRPCRICTNDERRDVRTTRMPLSGQKRLMNDNLYSQERQSVCKR